ncbi:lipoate--protein ligase family protein [Candidatus Peregrinibacteria bacterium]|nr:lipoate--protein ligase family protein [Candidatus Peregrinibacteria bacterium]
MALDEVLTQRIANGESEPTLRFYGWKPSAISIGYFQSLEAEVDLKKCEELLVDVVRRQTGGGAVFHDTEVTYSMHIPLSLKLVPEKVLESYQKICGGILKGLSRLEIEAQFAPLNDIVVDGQKISGNAQTRKQGILLQHGTILTSLDVEKMFDLLKVPDEKLKGKLISTVKERVTAIDRHLGKEISQKDVVNALVTGFSEEFPSILFTPSSLTEDETKAIQKLAHEKYEQRNWNSLR